MNLKTIGLAIGFVALALAIAVTTWQRLISSPGPLKAPVQVVIDNGEGPNRIALKLGTAGVITNPTVFKLAVRQLGVGPKLKAGEYEFAAGTSITGAIAKITSGDSIAHSVTIPEGYTTRQVLDTLAANEELSGTIIKRPGEGELFPDTYDYHLKTQRQKVVDEMARRMRSELDKAWAARNTLTPYANANDLLIMASIVQKEAANNAEMPQIAGVFVNRLNKKMRLQSDPTVIYGMESYKGNIQRKDLTDDNPFNTYKNDGLPPTPIANPGRAALLAAANPASTTALFFVVDVSGTGHVFSDTYEQHQKAVAKYVKANPASKPQPKAPAKAK
ncbi:MAG TPA: endolytic transglycosylase MltG [Alphaproteobacteria bacterium]|nr:endolytic transglycosylase MltG [Alphaproteobacteria bacterium]